jgi:hypothetical protein
MNIKIKYRLTGLVLWSGEAESMRDAVRKARASGADLRGAVLSDADLRGADLRGADLSDAVLRGAVLSDADLRGAVLRGAKGIDAATLSVTPLTDAERADMYAKRAAQYRARHPEVPFVENLDRQMLESIACGKWGLDMAHWHCGTTHCRAGGAIVLAGERGAELEKLYGPEIAGRMIYRASTGRAPNFFASTEDAMADIRKCAAAEESAGG